MRPARTARMIPVLMVVCLLTVSAPAQYSGGSGTPDDPYQIATPADLITLGETVADYGKHFIMTADIDLDPNLPGRKHFQTAVIAPGGVVAGLSFEIWPSQEAFGGTFDGNGHTISNLMISGGSCVGLFGILQAPAEIVDVGLVDANISGSQVVGALVGSTGWWPTAFNETSGAIARCYSTTSEEGYNSVRGRDYVGGLVGLNNYGGSVSECYSNGSVEGRDYVGGLVGRNRHVVRFCYSTASVMGYRHVGGSVGGNLDFGALTQCYSSGSVEGNTSIGGLVGSNKGSLEANFWDTKASGKVNGTGDGGPNPNGVTGKATSEMQDPTTFMAEGWDFVGQPDGPHDIWAEPTGGGYPILWWQQSPLPELSFSGGTGQPGDPYLISSGEELNRIGHNPRLMACHFRLANDVDLAGVCFYPIGNSELPYRGRLDGDGHRISNLTIEGHNFLGLVGSLHGGDIRDVGVADVNIIGTGSSIGGLVGEVYRGTVSQCYSTGSVAGGSLFVGGLVGWNADLPYLWCANISQCYSTSTVSGKWYVGGLVGGNTGGITNCYSTGTVSGSSYVGGLVGMNRQHGAITLSFWDIQTSGQTKSDGGTGLTTVEMQRANTFIDAAWDFVGETANGPNDVWKMWDRYDYPRLTCEPGPNTPLVFVDINDPGFRGQMSRYEVTNTQYCDFLNAALASGDITLNGADVEGAGGSNGGVDYVGQRYYRSDGSGYTGYGATNGGAARIHYSEGAFSVDEGFGNHPVTYVSWYGAVAFADYYGYCLPTEEQWQAVADYDGTYIYGCGETIDPGIANYRNSEHPDGTVPVGSYGLYGYGMSDMAGNVWEWTSSSLDGNRIFRGGSMGSIDADCDVSIRADGIPHANYWDIGFRVCR